MQLTTNSNPCFCCHVRLFLCTACCYTNLHLTPLTSRKFISFFDSSILPTGLLFNLPQKLLLIDKKLWNVTKLNCCRLSVNIQFTTSEELKFLKCLVCWSPCVQSTNKCHYISEPQYLLKGGNTSEGASWFLGIFWTSALSRKTVGFREMDVFLLDLRSESIYSDFKKLSYKFPRMSLKLFKEGTFHLPFFFLLPQHFKDLRCNFYGNILFGFLKSMKNK